MRALILKNSELTIALLKQMQSEGKKMNEETLALITKVSDDLGDISKKIDTVAAGSVTALADKDAQIAAKQAINDNLTAQVATLTAEVAGSGTKLTAANTELDALKASDAAAAEVSKASSAALTASLQTLGTLADTLDAKVTSEIPVVPVGPGVPVVPVGPGVPVVPVVEPKITGSI